MEGQRKRCSWRGYIGVTITPLLLLLLLLSVIQVAAAQSEPSEQELRDAILGRIPMDLNTMDLNSDGKVDVADLVYRLKIVPPEVNFATLTSEIEEGSGPVSVQVSFWPEFSGTLRYSVSPEPPTGGTCPENTPGGCSTATAGIDYAPLSGSIAVSGESVDIPIMISDDAQLEDVETIVLILTYDENENPGYLPGRSIFHTVYVHDNDARWNGTLEPNNGPAVHLQMQILQQGAFAAGALLSDGYGIIPLNGASPEWPAQMTLSNTSFEATVEGIIIPAESTLAKVEMARTLVFQGNAVNSTSISGTMTEIVTCAAAPQFAYTTDGTFTLRKQISEVPEELINP